MIESKVAQGYNRSWPVVIGVALAAAFCKVALEVTGGATTTQRISGIWNVVGFSIGYLLMVAIISVMILEGWRDCKTADRPDPAIVERFGDDGCVGEAAQMGLTCGIAMLIFVSFAMWRWFYYAYH